MRKKFFNSFLFFFLAFYFGFTQPKIKSYSFKSISTADGLSNNIIYDILQDKDGYMWFATDNGLNRYDGYTSKKFFHNPEDSSSVSSSVIRCLIQDKKGNIWIGTKEGLNLYDKEKESFKRFAFSDKNSFVNHEIMKMNLDNNGNLWINTLNDIGVFNTTDFSFQLIYTTESNPFKTISKDKIWILNSEGELNFYDITEEKFQFFLKDSTLKKKGIHYGKYSNTLWLPHDFTSNSGALNYRNIPKLPGNISYNYLLETDPNTLLIGSNSGLFEYKYNLDKLEKIELDQSALVQQIRSIYEDDYNGIWVGTLAGVYHYDPNRRVFNHYDIKKDSDDVIMGIHAIDNRVFVNTLGEGLYIHDISSKKNKKIEFPENFSNQNLFIWDIEKIDQNYFPIWLATNNGLLCYDPIYSKFKKINLPITNKDKNISFSILDTGDEYMWVSSYRSIHKINKKDQKILKSIPLDTYIKHSGIQKIIALENYIFAATDGEGLLYYNTVSETISKASLNNKVLPFKSPIWDLFKKDNTLWIGCNQGLYKLNIKDMIVQPVLEDDQVIYSIIQDNSGVLWMGTDNGIKSYNYLTNSFKNYDTDSGLKNKEFNRKSVAKTKDDHLWFGGVNGITSFNPEAIKKENPNIPSVHITNITLFASDTSYAIPHFQKNITVPWKYNTIEISYVGLNYTNTAQNTYKYKMQGYDPNWVTSNTPNKARYVKLPIGTYNFNVTASNNDGLYNTIGDSLIITITPPIWRTKLAYFLYVLGLIAIIGLIRSLKKSRSRIKEVEIEKEEISKKVDQLALVLNNKTKIYLDQLMFIKSDGNYLEFVTDKKTVIDRNKLKSILQELPPNFVRVHRSYVVNKNFIDSSNSTTLFLHPNIEIPISRTFKSNLI